MASPKSGHKRGSIANIFPVVNAPSTGTSSVSPANLAQSLRNKMRTALLPGGSVRARSLRIPASFTISIGDAYDYNILGDDHDPDDLYEEMVKYATEVAEALQLTTPHHSQVVDDHLLEVRSRMVFGSNFIERAGAGLDITLKICQDIFKGALVPNTIPERDHEYLALKEDIIKQGLPSDSLFVFRSRREIIQHAKAARHMITEVYLHEKDLTEGIILDTHRILTHSIDTEQGYSWTQYSGVYRNQSVVAGLHVFPPPDDVPALMRKMIATLDQDLQNAVKAGTIDPVTLATKYCHSFVNIHPFLDGNGRICRLILNTLLLKYGGFLVCIGQEDDTREKYLEIAASASLRQASDQGDDWDEDDVSRPKHYKELASFTLKHATDGFRKFVHALKGKQEK